jgi:hypothetical protein
MVKSLARFATGLLSGCVLLSACGPSIDGAAKTDIDQRLAVLAPSGQTFPVPAVLVPKTLVVGQWTLYKLVGDKGEPSLVTHKIVGEEGGAFWVETANESYYGKTVTKILLSIGDRTNPSTMQIHVVKMKDKKGKVSELSGPAIQPMQSMWQGSVNMLAVSWQGLPQEGTLVVAGSFAGCFKARTDASWGPWHALSTTWMHPAVPISGLVRSVGIDRPTTMELIGFGEAGATTEIP